MQLAPNYIKMLMSLFLLQHSVSFSLSLYLTLLPRFHEIYHWINTFYSRLFGFACFISCLFLLWSFFSLCVCAKSWVAVVDVNRTQMCWNVCLFVFASLEVIQLSQNQRIWIWYEISETNALQHRNLIFCVEIGNCDDSKQITQIRVWT